MREFNNKVVFLYQMNEQFLDLPLNNKQSEIKNCTDC